MSAAPQDLAAPRDFDVPVSLADRAYLAGILRHNECRPPTAPERRQLEAWFNDGRHAEPEESDSPAWLGFDYR